MFEKAISINPKYADSFNNLGKCFIDVENLNQAYLGNGIFFGSENNWWKYNCRLGYFFSSLAIGNLIYASNTGNSTCTIH